MKSAEPDDDKKVVARGEEGESLKEGFTLFMATGLRRG